jgi:3-dehydroquinate dehydratase / shikimate dehydrogenase
MNMNICVPITEKSAEAFLNAIEEAAQLANIVELRMDYLDDEECLKVQQQLPSIALKLSNPLIMTFRPREQGGMRDLSMNDRHLFWERLSGEVKSGVSYVDLELDLVETLESPPVPWSKVICSWHDFSGTPSNLFEIYQRIARTPAAAVKVATQANRIGDCLQLFELLERREATRPVIVLGMGAAGMMTRVLALSRGAMLTFGALRRGAESASGQPTADELINLYRVQQISRESEIYGIIGKPIGHSHSPLLHNAALKAVHRDGVYLPFEVDDINEFMRDFVRPSTRRIEWRLRGLSVTIPHKLAIVPLLDFVDPTARRIGAVNTVVVEGDELHGYNTDVTGVMRPLDKSIDLEGAEVAVLGAGGAARAVCYGLKQRGAIVTIYARDPGKAQSLADEFGAKLRQIESFGSDAEVVINCTPIGMRGHSEGESPIGAERLGSAKLVYDLVYNPEETALLRQARAAGCRTLGGLAMLVSQAAEQFRLWTGLEMPKEEITEGAVRGA